MIAVNLSLSISITSLSSHFNTINHRDNVLATVSCSNGHLLPIHTIHILKAVVPAVNLAYLGTVYMHPVTRLIFRKIVGINWQY